METQSIFKFLLTGAIVSAITFTSCENKDNTSDSNSETTEGDVNDPTKYNSGSNTSTRTGGSMGMNDQDNKDASDLVSEHQGSGNDRSGSQRSGSNTTGGQSSGNSDMNTSNSGTDLGGTSGGTQNINNTGSSSKNTTSGQSGNNNTQGTSATTGQNGRSSGIR